jgi:hypothetical protein
MAAKHKPIPTIKQAINPFMVVGFNPPKRDNTKDVSFAPVNRSNDGSVHKKLYKMEGTVKKSNVSSGKGVDLVKDKIKSSIRNTVKKVNSSIISKGSGKCGPGINLCRSKNKF